MSKRKDQLRSLFGGGDQAPETKSAIPPAPQMPAGDPVRRSTSGAIKAMGLSLGSLGQEVEEARRLRNSLDAADRVVDLDPSKIEHSPFRDRLTSVLAPDELFEPLKQSLLEHGQQVPILVRPHPDSAKAENGLYQAAYGHRRIEAARQLGLTVKAVVRTLSDVDLVTAQGRENGERRDLSFIERVVFAATLSDAGFPRQTIMAALGVDKTELSRLLQVAEAVPRHIADHIGPAPKIGRPRWMALSELLASEAKRAIADTEIGLPRFREADTNQRFQLLFDRLSARQPAQKAGSEHITAPAGGRIAELQRKKDSAIFVIPAKAGAGFADFVASELPRLHAAYLKRQTET